MRKLIINADDFGFNREITDAILECHELGTVTSTTMMANMPAFEYAVEKAKSLPDLSVGIHLNITLGRPVAPPNKVSDLLDADGYFLDQGIMFKKGNRFLLPSDQVKREFTAQIEKFLASGLTPSHCDTHHHIGATLQPFIIKLNILKKFGIMRIRTHRSFFHSDRLHDKRGQLFLQAFKQNVKTLPIRIAYELEHFYSKLNSFKLTDARFSLPRIISSPPLEYNIQGWDIFISNLPEGLIETTVHPAKPNEDPMDRKEYRDHRVVEYQLLSNPEVLKIIKKNRIELINFNQI